MLAERSICQETTSRKRNDVNFGHLDGICQTLPSNHYHTLLFIPPYVDAEKMLKPTIIHVLSTAQNAHVKSMTVSYPEKFLRAETNKLNTSAISVRGEKMQSLLKKKTTDGIGCNFKCTWDMKSKIHWERPVIQRRHCFFFYDWLSLRSQTRRSKTP